MKAAKTAYNKCCWKIEGGRGVKRGGRRGKGEAEGAGSASPSPLGKESAYLAQRARLTVLKQMLSRKMKAKLSVTCFYRARRAGFWAIWVAASFPPFDWVMGLGRSRVTCTHWRASHYWAYLCPNHRDELHSSSKILTAPPCRQALPWEVIPLFLMLD